MLLIMRSYLWCLKLCQIASDLKFPMVTFCLRQTFLFFFFKRVSAKRFRHFLRVRLGEIYCFDMLKTILRTIVSRTSNDCMLWHRNLLAALPLQCQVSSVQSMVLVPSS